MISFFPYSSFSIYPFPNIIPFFFSVQESYFNAISSAPIIIYEEDELDYDSDGNPVIPEGARVSLCTGQYDYLGRLIQRPFHMIVCPEGLLIIYFAISLPILFLLMLLFQYYFGYLHFLIFTFIIIGY